MEMFVVKNLVGGIVVIKVPNENRIFELKGLDSRVKINYDDLEKMVYDADSRRIFETGLAWIEDKDCRIRLGLEEEDGTANFEKLILDKKQIISLLYAESFKTFKEKLDQLSEGSKELLISVAIENPKQLDYEKSDIIRKKFLIDVEGIKRMKREEEAEKTKEG